MVFLNRVLHMVLHIFETRGGENIPGPITWGDLG